MSLGPPNTGDVLGGRRVERRRVTLEHVVLAFGLAAALASEVPAQIRPLLADGSSASRHNAAIGHARLSDVSATAAPLPLVLLAQAPVAAQPVPQPAPTRPAAPRRPAERPAGAPPPAPDIDPAERALIESRFDEVDRLAAVPPAGGPSDAAPAATPPAAVVPEGEPRPPEPSRAPPAVRAVLKARADAARGRYEEALTSLRALAASEPAGDAALELGLLLDVLGRRDEAREQWMAIVRSSDADRGADRLRRAARAFAALGEARRASGLLQEATAIAPNDARVHTAWAELFLDKQNTKEAIEVFEAALKADPRWVPALVGLARSTVNEDPATARGYADKALAIAPGSIEARLVLAELALDERRLDDARGELARALEVNPVSLPALAMRGALAFLEAKPDEVDALAAKAFAVNPKYGDFHRVVAAQAAAHYRFDEAVAIGKKGLAIDDTSPRIQAELGMHLLRVGEEAEARPLLERAFQADRYDVVTYNLLQLLDVIDGFESFTDEELVIKMHPDEAAVMREPVAKLAREALVSLSQRYGFTPKGPILIEMFSKHDDFAVRTLGLPGMVGALGACFGRVVTLDSPRASRTPGSFNWGATLWHEMAHVLALQLSAQRVPRWITEGASVFEERRAHPSWGREGEHDFLVAYARGELLKLAEINRGFSSAKTIGLAYHQSSLVVEHLVGKYGDAGLQRLIKTFAGGATDEEALKSSLGISMAELQTSFDQYLDGRFAAARRALQPPEAPPPAVTEADGTAPLVAYADAHAGSYDIQVRTGRRLFDADRLDEARRILERAVTLVPQTMGDESARVGLAELALKQGDQARAMQELELVLDHGHTAMESARKLLSVAREAGDQARLQRAADRIIALDPFDSAARTEIGRAALARQDTARAVRELELAIKLGVTDKAAAHVELAEAYLQAGQPDSVKRHAIAALEIAPRFERAQELLLRVVDGR